MKIGQIVGIRDMSSASLAGCENGGIAKDWYSHDWMRKKTREDEMLIELISGSVWQLVGSDNYNSKMVNLCPVSE